MKWSETVLGELRSLAELGNVSAQCRLGDFYATGTRGDLAMAVVWYQKAAEAGYYRALAILGDLYAKGDGVEADPAIAADWYLKAADQGSARAFLALIRMPQIGASARVPDRAFAKSKQSAEDGDPEAQCWLGIAYEHGMCTTSVLQL